MNSRAVALVGPAAAVFLLACGCARPPEAPVGETDPERLEAQEEALRAAARAGAVAEVEALLDEGLRPEAALVAAAGDGRLEVLKLLLERQVEVDGLTGSRALYGAVMGGHAEAEGLLKASGAGFNGTDERGRSLLLRSAKWSKASRVRRLLGLGADPELATHTGRTPLMAAAERGHVKIVELLIRRGADPGRSERDGFTALLLAVRAGRARAVAALLRAGADPNAVTRLGWSAVHEAARGGDAQLIQSLLDAGADPSLATHSAASPLVEAIKRGHSEAAATLLRAGADPSARFFGADALWWARRLARHDLVELLAASPGDAA